LLTVAGIARRGLRRAAESTGSGEWCRHPWARGGAGV